MASLPYSADELTHAHLQALIDAEAGESIVLEFKSLPYAPDHDGTREFLKDATAFANTSGGYLLIGVEEADGIATAFAPIAVGDADKIKQRLESLLQTAIEPRIFGARMKAVPVPGGCVIAIRIPRSQAPPHRVTAKNSNRFYLRSSAGAYEASMEELRTLFLETAAARDRVISFRDHRLAEIAAGRPPIQLTPGDDMFVLHIMPMSSLSLAPSVDLAKARQDTGAFRPLAASGWNHCFNFLGLLASRGGTACHGYTQLFREGMVEAVYHGILGSDERRKSLYAPHIADLIVEYAPHYIEALAKVGASPPFFVAATLLGVDGASVVVSDRRWFGDAQPVVGDVALPICVVEDLGADEEYVAALKPALDALWNAADQPGWTAQR